MKMWIGTFSDEVMSESLRNEYKNKYNKIYYSDKDIKEMEDYIKESLSKGIVAGGITQFFAKDLGEAFKMAKQMGLKNFSKVCDKLYEQGKDYK